MKRNNQDIYSWLCGVQDQAVVPATDSPENEEPGVVIRNARGNNAEARNQLTLLFTAQLERMLQLHNIQENNERGGGHPLLPPVVGFTVVSHHWSCYIGYRGTVDGQEKVISVLLPPYQG